MNRRVKSRADRFVRSAWQVVATAMFGFPGELVEEVDVMHTASGDNDDGGKVALEGQQGVEFDGGFGAAEGGPRKEREAEVNGGGVQRIRRRLKRQNGVMFMRVGGA